MEIYSYVPCKCKKNKQTNKNIHIYLCWSSSSEQTNICGKFSLSVTLHLSWTKPYCSFCCFESERRDWCEMSDKPLLCHQLGRLRKSKSWIDNKNIQVWLICFLYVKKCTDVRTIIKGFKKCHKHTPLLQILHWKLLLKWKLTAVSSCTFIFRGSNAEVKGTLLKYIQFPSLNITYFTNKAYKCAAGLAPGMEELV